MRKVTKDIYDAERAQDQANEDLETASQDQDQAKDRIQKVAFIYVCEDSRSSRSCCTVHLITRGPTLLRSDCTSGGEHLSSCDSSLRSKIK